MAPLEPSRNHPCEAVCAQWESPLASPRLVLPIEGQNKTVAAGGIASRHETGNAADEVDPTATRDETVTPAMSVTSSRRAQLVQTA